ncbi:MAG: sensor domain-containing diguanylate cyclase [Athalassotoga sp.]
MVKSPKKLAYLFAFVIVTAVFVWISYWQYSSIKANIINEIKDQSMLLSIGMDEFMGYYKTAGVAFNNRILQNSDLLQNSSNLDYLLSNYTIHLAPQIKSVEILSPEGSLIGTSGNAPEIKLSDLYFGQKILGIGTLTESKLLPVGYKITENGKVIAILVMNVDLGSLLDKWAQSIHSIQDSLSLSVIRSDGIGIWASSKYVKPIEKLNAGYVKINGEYSWIEPMSLIETFSVAQISQWGLMALYYRYLIYFILVWCLLIIIIYLFYRQSTRYERQIHSLIADQNAKIEELTHQKHRFEILKSMYDSVILVENELLEAKDEDDILQGVCDRMTEIGLFDFVGIAIPNDKKILRYKFLSGNAKELVLTAQNEFPDDASVLYAADICFKTQRIFVLSEIQKFEPDGYEKIWIDKVYESQGWKDVIALPLFRNGSIYGILSATSKTENFFAGEIKALAEIFAKILGNTLENIDARKKLISQLFESQYLATHDPLTGLFNRIGIMERVDNVISRSKREKKYMAVGIIDIDDFKLVNDTYGHSAGDNLLIEFGRRLESLIRGEDLIGRIGGDEFVMVILVKSEEDIDILMKRFEISLSEPFKVGDESIYVKVSVGFTLYPEDNNEFDVLLRHADKALYVKKETKNRRNKFWGIYKSDDFV